ncbi:MarR family winged helix-turn-helix transcriptional regulator [Acholeplasma sp. OttesenSCG-928-E16]|nr:MarR family winged helix-turn-helix transcriptional regulator [Acholeplasma sp. OttesenSCG-928-E16]
MESLKGKLTNSLLNIYRLDFVSTLGDFLYGEQAVLFNLSIIKDSDIGTIGENSNISKSRMSAVIKSLLRKKYITIKNDPKDKRKKIVILSKTGQMYINEKLIEAEQILNDCISKMGKEKTKELIDLLDYMSERMGFNGTDKISQSIENL